MYSDPVDIGVIHKPDDLVREELSIVLGGEVGLSWLRGVQLEGLANTFSQDIEGRISLHYLSHGLLYQWLHSRDPVTKGTEEDNFVTFNQIFTHRETKGFPNLCKL